MSKLICMGECLIDFLPLDGELSFAGKAGGAPTNVCAAVGKLGGESYYLGMMARDNFSNFLLEKLKKCNVKTDYISFTDKAGTGLAFVSLDKNGDRSFSFLGILAPICYLIKTKLGKNILIWAMCYIFVRSTLWIVLQKRLRKKQ